MIQPPEDFLPVANVGSQIERAIAAWLVRCGAGTPEQQYTTHDGRTRVCDTGPLNDICAYRSTEDVAFTRNEAMQVSITCEFPGITQPENPDKQYNRKEIDHWIGTVMAAMSSSDNNDQDYSFTCAAITDAGRSLAVDESAGADPVQVQSAVDNADMAAFTCYDLRYLGFVRAETRPDGTYFVEKRLFEIGACAKNVD